MNNAETSVKHLRSALRGVAISLVTIAVSFAGCRWYWLRELREVTDALSAIPDVAVKDAWGTEEPSGLKSIWAAVRVEDRADLLLFGLSLDSLQGAQSFCLAMVDDKRISFSAFGQFGEGPERSSRYGGCWRFGKNTSDQPKIFPVEVQTVQDLVKQVSAMTDTLNQWPRCPGYIVASTPSRRYQLCTTAELHSNDYPPPVEPLNP